MSILSGSESSVLETLNNLIELDFDAVAAYEAAINRLDDPATKDRLGEFMSDHQRHIQELGAAVRDLGQLPPQSGGALALLTQGKVVIGDLMGDKGILLAMRANEEVTNQAYENALQRDDLAPRVQGLLEQNLGDERRHRAWIQNRLEEL